jgi:dihydrolipoamide dehydrogenase
VGGGYIGLELGTVYAALGSEVTCVEMTGGLLPGADRDLVKPLHTRLETQFKEILLNTKIADMKEQKTGIKVTLEGEDLKKPQRTFDKVLISIGRKPNSSGLGLKSTGVVVNDRGFIEVDAQMRTADANIFAIGDIVGGAMLAHKASAEGRVAAEVIAGHHSAFEPQAIPAVVFTDPEIAWCGLTEDEAQRAGRTVHVARFPWAASGRATTINRMEGLTKLISDPETKQLLGMGIVGSGAGELIAEGTLAIEMGALVSDIDLTIHPHPTLSETVMEAIRAASNKGCPIFLRRNCTGNTQAGLLCHIPLAVTFDLKSSFRKECGTAVSAVFGCVATKFSSSMNDAERRVIVLNAKTLNPWHRTPPLRSRATNQSQPGVRDRPE